MTDNVTFELYEVERGYPPLLVVTVTAERAEAEREIMHYAMVYGQDGPVEVKERMRRRSKNPLACWPATGER